MKRVLWIAVGWIACGALWCPMSWATNYYVRSTDGSDADNGTTWALAEATLAAGLGDAVAGDTVWVSDNHSETQASAMTLTFPATPGLRVLCGDDAAEPPTALATSCVVASTGNFTSDMPASGFAYIYGITFQSGSGSAGGSVNLRIVSGAIPSGVIFDSCAFQMLGTSTTFRTKIGNQGGANIDDMLARFINCTFKFSHTGQGITLQSSRIEFINVALDAAGSIPTTLFAFAGGNTSIPIVSVEASDLSARAWTNLVSVAATYGQLFVRNCKLPASITLVTGTRPGVGGPVIKMHNCDSADTHVRIAEDRYEGATISETTIVRTGGASDGTTPISWKMTASANTQFYAPLESPEIAVWNNSTGASQTVTVEFVHDSVTNLQDDEIWMEVQYYGTSGVPQGTIITDRMTNILSTAADQADSSATWTTTGLTNPNTQKLNVSFTPQEIGYYLIKVMVANPSQVVYVCPKADLT